MDQNLTALIAMNLLSEHLNSENPNSAEQEDRDLFAHSARWLAGRVASTDNATFLTSLSKLIANM
jgi:hypothetical protein